jgi:hypothetical protein
MNFSAPYVYLLDNDLGHFSVMYSVLCFEITDGPKLPHVLGILVVGQ